MRNLITICLILLGGTLFAQETITKTFSGIDEIEMSVASGDVNFQKGGSDVSIELVYTYDFDYQPTMEKRGSTLIIKEERNQMPRNYSGSATWTFKVPADIEIEFNTGSGDVEITDLSLEAKMNSGSGDFALDGVDGEFKINTGSGDINIDNAQGELGMNTGSGDIELDGINAEINANTGSGDITSKDTKLAGRSSFNAGSGDVEITLSSTLEYNISLNSGSGDATLDFDGNQIEGEIIMEVNKRYGEIVAPFDFDTSEEINEGNNTRIRKTKKMGSKDVKIRIGSGSGTAEIKN